MDIAKLVSKNIQDLQGYVAVEDVCNHEQLNSAVDSIALKDSENFLGFYLNNHDTYCDSIMITNHRILFETGGKLDEIVYLDIKECCIADIGGNKVANKLTIIQKDNSFKELSIDGVKNNRFLDVYGFERFIKKILVNIKLDGSVFN
jgi:hypothetical protein